MSNLKRTDPERNILDDFIVVRQQGLYCKYGNFYLDPKEAVPLAVISHAHGDHAVNGNGEVYGTAATIAIMIHRYGKFAGDRLLVQEYGKPFYIGSVKLCVYPAGHILGSSLVLMEYAGVKYLYTGDFKLQHDPTCEPLEFIKADVLITETTFADPQVQHPEATEEIKKLNEVKGNLLLGAYALGKSQRLVELITQHCPTKRILMHHRIMPLMKIYEQFGRQLGNYEVYDRKVMKQHDGLIYIVPPMVYHSYIRAINVTRIFVTGWKQKQAGQSLSLYISDHADWKELLTMIAETNPREVWTTHGDGKQLQNYFTDNLVVKLL